MTISGRHIDDGAIVVVDGRPINGVVRRTGKDRYVVELAKLPPEGMHLLQVQNPGGQFSNDFIFHVTKDAKAAAELTRRIDESHVDVRSALATAIARGNLADIKKLLGRKARRINERQPRGGSTPLSDAALHGRLDVVKYLLERGAKVDATNRDGNTPLHVAAFLCRKDIVKLLLEKGASPLTKNRKGETAIAVVSSKWSQGVFSGFLQRHRTRNRPQTGPETHRTGTSANCQAVAELCQKPQVQGNDDRCVSQQSSS